MISCVYNLWPNDYSQFLDIFLILNYNRPLTIVHWYINIFTSSVYPGAWIWNRDWVNQHILTCCMVFMKVKYNIDSDIEWWVSRESGRYLQHCYIICIIKLSYKFPYFWKFSIMKEWNVYFISEMQISMKINNWANFVPFIFFIKFNSNINRERLLGHYFGAELYNVQWTIRRLRNMIYHGCISISMQCLSNLCNWKICGYIIMPRHDKSLEKALGFVRLV